MLYYSAVNLVDVDTVNSVSTEDTLYVKENLYGGRPSKPFYFTVKAAQWVEIDLLASALVQVCGIFNHNFTSGATLSLKTYSDAWLTQVYNATLTYREHDLYQRISQNRRWLKLNVSDAGNADYPRIGEFWLGTLSKFDNAHLQPGREDGVDFYASEQQTAYGQDWDTYLSESKRLRISFKSINDPNSTDDVEAFLSSIGGPAGRFLLIPDDARPHVYMVKVVGSPSAKREIYGGKELRTWGLDLKVLSRGITLL